MTGCVLNFLYKQERIRLTPQESQKCCSSLRHTGKEHWLLMLGCDWRVEKIKQFVFSYLDYTLHMQEWVLFSHRSLTMLEDKIKKQNFEIVAQLIIFCYLIALSCNQSQLCNTWKKLVY